MTAALAAWALYAIRPRDGDAKQPPASSSAREENVQRAPAASRKKSVSQVPDNGRPQLELSDLAIKAFIEKTDSSTPAVAALYHYTKDSVYRAELEKRLLVDPDASIFLAVHDYIESQRRGEDSREAASRRLALLQKAHAAFPNHEILAGMLAGTHAALGKHAEALSLLSDNRISQSLRDGAVARQEAMRVLMVAGGLDEQRAWIASSLAEADHEFAISSMINFLTGSTKTLQEYSIDAQVELVSRIASLARALNPNYDVSGTNAVVARSLETMALRAMPSETEYGNSGATVAERLAEIKEESRRDRQLQIQLESLLRTADPATVQGFLQRREQFGHPVAVQWMQQQIAKGK